MRDAFTPVFLAVLAALAAAHELAPPSFPFRPLALAAFALFPFLFVLRRLGAAYAALILTAVLFYSGAYLARREAHEAGRGLFVPPAEYVTVKGRLRAFPEIGAGRSVLCLEAASVSWPGGGVAGPLGMRVVVHGDLRGLHRGGRVEVEARVDPRAPNRNFFPNPYEDFLLSRDLQLTAFSKSAQLARETGRAPLFWRLIGAWRNRVRGAIERRYLRGKRLEAAGVFLEATLLGDRGRLENGEQEELIGSGVFHLLAISGGNIALLALAALLAGRWLRLPLKARYGSAALLLLLFLAFSGFDVSAARAVLMALLVFAGRVWFMDVEPGNVISFCGLLLLALNPAHFLDPGFVLTFALTGAILAGRRLFRPWRLPLPRWASELLSANGSAALMALPLSLRFFQRFAFSGFFSGLLLAPLAAGVTVCGVLLLFLAWLPGWAADLALLPAGLLLDAFFAASGWIHGHASWSVFRPSPPLGFLALAGAAFYLSTLERLKGWQRATAALLLAGLLLGVSLPPRRHRPRRLELYFLDVGHGDAIAAVFPGGDALLVDGGGSSFSDFQVGRRLVLPFLLQKRIHVRWAAASHYHPDHAEGLAEILPILKPEELWISSAAAEDGCFAALMAAAPPGTRIRRVARGFALSQGEIRLECLWPPQFIEAQRTANDHSMVLRVARGRASFLLAGDIETGPELELAGRDGGGLASATLKVPHHGSRTSSSPAFLDAVAPELAVISAPAFSSHGFPHREVVRRLKQRGIRWLGTARRGGICISSTREGLQIQVSR